MTAATPRERGWIAGGALVFCLLAILNSGGYHYGVGDQAFYVPAVVQHLKPALFPRDRPLLHVQDRFMAIDDGMAALAATGIPLPYLSFVLYLASLLLLYGAAIAIGGTLYHSRWTTATLVLLLTLRHRITQTGANSLESYFHPRMLAFGIGASAVALYLRRRHAAALALVPVAFLIHPTTGIWFGILIAMAIAADDARWRRVLLLLVPAGAAAAIWMIAAGPLRGHLARMDPRWASVLAGKDYVFPMDWGPAFWLVNLGYAVLIGAAIEMRRRRGTAIRQERGLLLGGLALLAVFLISWPLMRVWIALALQLQTSRIFWLLDFMAAIYVAWLLVEGLPRRTGRAAAMVLLAAGAARGVYVMAIEHRSSPLVALRLPADDWSDAMRWIATSEPGSHVLADPGHAWKYGSSVRVGGERDVYVEEVKDAALALYSREVAMRVLGRMQDAHDFGALDAGRALALASQYDLDYLVIDRDMRLPLLYRNHRFRIYALKSR